MEDSRFLYCLALMCAVCAVLVAEQKRRQKLEAFALAHADTTLREYQALNERLVKLEEIKPKRKPPARKPATRKRSG